MINPTPTRRAAVAVSWVRASFGTLLIALFASPIMAQTDEFTSQINRGYLGVSADKRSDLILLPLIAKMEAAPMRVRALSDAAIMPADVAAFAECRAWAEKPEQQAVIAALATVSKEKKWRESFVWGLPYGIEDVPTEFVEARLYSELGDPPTIAGARHYWIPRLDDVASLVNVEATRLLADGKASDAIDMLMNWANVCRQIGDRQLQVEAKWGLTHLAQAFERIRDVAYADLRGAKTLDLARVPDQVKSLAIETPLDVTRLRLPKGDSIAAAQVAARVFSQTEEVIPAVFGPTLARIGSADFPLRVFSESSRWRGVAAAHADGRDTKSKINSVQSDFTARWELDWFDRRHLAPTEYTKLEPARFALIARTMPDLRELYDLRMMCFLEMQGSQLSLCLAAATIANKTQPKVLTVVRPRWIEVIRNDPLSKNIETGQFAIPRYFIPMQRRPGMSEKETPKPHEIDIVPAMGSPFSVRLDDTQMVLYSVGVDSADNSAKRVQNTMQLATGTDYLMWPPVVSLYRQHLRDSQQLK